MKEVGGKGTSCVQCVKIKKMCNWADKGKGKEVKKRVTKKVRSEVQAGPSQVREEEDDSIEDNSQNLTVALWAIVDAIHNMKDENQCFWDMLIHNVLKPLMESTIAMGLAMKEWTWYLYVKSAKKDQRRVGVSRGVGTEEVVLTEATEVQSGGSRGTSGGESSQTLADQDVEMGGAEVGVGEGEGAGGEEGGEEGGEVSGEAVVGNSTA
jgi:hypothetical protein